MPNLMRSLQLGRFTVNKRTQLLLIVVSVLLLGLVAAYTMLRGHEGGALPSRGDIEASVFVQYPDSSVVKDVFQEADSGRYLDTGSFRNPMQLIRRYRFMSKVPRSTFQDWLSKNYPTTGWVVVDRLDLNHTTLGKTTNSREHRLEIVTIAELEDPSVSEYEMTYSIS